MLAISDFTNNLEQNPPNPTRNDRSRNPQTNRRGGFMLAIYDFTNNHEQNPPNPTSKDRGFCRSLKKFGI
jgi:hypothetical protein